MEAPEKIFISYETDENGCIYPDYMWHRHPFEGVENIEYTRTDTFIKKTCKFLKSYRQDTHDGMGYIAGIVNGKTIEDFKDFIKGE